MYLTSDGEVVNGGAEGVLAENSNEAKVRSYDVEKAGKIFTVVPRHGRQRLLNYLMEVERRLSNEVEARKTNVSQLRERMARNRTYNAKARNSMKRAMLHRMAQNAKQAQARLDHSMALTARNFARQASTANRRWAQNNARFKRTRQIMRRNKRQAARSLHMAVLTQQRALSALASKTNSHISQTNAHIAANAAQIRSNARKARHDLARANHRFDRKMFNMQSEAKKGRSKLAARSASMNKKLRFMISGKIKSITASAAAQFKQVRTRMARDRMHADMALKQSTTKLSAALHTQKLLQNKRFRQTVANLNNMKRESNKRIAAAKSYFKVNLLQLRSTVKYQVNKLNSRVTQLQGTIRKNRLEQARINTNVNAETKRMIKLGNQRERTLAKKDAQLRSMQLKNQRALDSRIKNTAKSFNMRMRNIRRRMKRNRAHAEHALAKQTRALYATLAKNAKMQETRNQQIKANTRRARLDAMRALRSAKHSFTKRLAGLTATVVRNDKKADRRIKHLAGVETANAIKSANGRRMLRIMQKSNKNLLKNSIRTMVHKGEARALTLEKSTSKMMQKTRTALNMKVTMQISALAKRTHASIEQLRVENKRERALLKKQVTYAVRSAAALAKKNLKKMVSWSNKKFNKLNKKLAATEKANAAGRGSLMRAIARERKRAERAVKDAVSNQNRALLALKTETAKKIAKTNTRVDAYANAIAKHAKQVDAQMKANTNILLNKVNDAKIAANAKLAGLSAASIKRHKAALSLVAASIKKARKESKRKFKGAYTRMAKDRASADRALARQSSKLTAAIAKRSALYDARFQKTVKSIQGARKAAAAEVAQAKKSYTTSFVKIRASIKDQETRLRAEIAEVSTEVSKDKENQRRINRKVAAETKRIQKLMDAHALEAKRARGKLRSVMQHYRNIAKAEKNNLGKRAQSSLGKLAHHCAAMKRQVAQDLSRATRKMHVAIDSAQRRQNKERKRMKGMLLKAKMGAARALHGARSDWKAKVTMLTNTITAGRNKFQRGLNRVTGVAQSWKKNSVKDRKLLKTQVKSMQQDMHRNLLRAIAIGTAKAKAAEERAVMNMKSAKKALSGEISTRIERMADQVFKASDKKRQHIANNYLALKAYCRSGANRIINYTTKNGGSRGLSSVGDVLATIASFSGVRTKAQQGVGAGLKKVIPLFGGKKIKASTALSRYNGLVDEYSNIMVLVRRRWPYGLGHYLLGKVGVSMQKTGLLKYVTMGGKTGKRVVVNGHAIGLSNKLTDFDKLSVSSRSFQSSLKTLSKHLPPSIKTSKVAYAPPVWWKGN